MSTKNEIALFRIVTVNKGGRITIPKDLYGKLKTIEGESFIITAMEQEKDTLILKIKRVTAKDLAGLA